MHIVAQFDREQETDPPEFAVPHETPRANVPRVTSGETSLGRVLESNAVSAFVTFILTIAVCGALYYAYQHWPRSQPKPVVKPVAVAAPVAQPTPPLPISASVPSPLSAVAPSKDTHPVRVALTASAPCWTRIVVDGKTQFAGLLTAGEQRTLEADTNVTIRAGNAGALALKLNGNDVPAIGPKGQIRTVTLTAAGAQVRTPTLDPVVDF